MNFRRALLGAGPLRNWGARAGCAVLLVVGGLCSGCSPRENEELQRRQALVDAFVAASHAGDDAAIMELYHLEGVPAEHRQFLRFAIIADMDYPIERIHFRPPAPEDRIDYWHEGRYWGPNLEPALMMIVEYETENGYTTGHLVGLLDGEYRFVGSRPLAPPAQEAQAQAPRPPKTESSHPATYDDEFPLATRPE